MGRLSLFDPAYCDKVVEWGNEGKSRVWIAAELGVTRQTLHNWMKEFPDFGEAMALAQTLAQKWWEDAGQNALEKVGFQASVWSRSMSARFPEDWREHKGVELSGPNGGAMKAEHNVVVSFRKGAGEGEPPA